MSATRMNYAVHQRLRMIDLLLQQYGFVGRQTISDYFGISTVQASLDLQDYGRQAPGNCRYEPALKAHARLPTFKRTFP